LNAVLSNYSVTILKATFKNLSEII